MNERWKPVVGYEGCYEVSDLGGLRSLDRIAANGRRLKGRPMAMHKRAGFLSTELWRDGKPSKRLVHKLVLEAFIGPCPYGLRSRHIDGDAFNNRLSNLKWDTPSNIMNGLHQ